MAKSIFDFESEDRVESPERLNEYIRVANPGVWVGICALILVLAAFIVWGFTGRIPETASFKGVVDGTNHFKLDVVVDASQYAGKNLVGKEVSYYLPDGITRKGTVTDSTELPLSGQELTDILESDYLSASLISSDYSYLIEVTPEDNLADYDLQIAHVTVITDEVKPIYFLLR